MKKRKKLTVVLLAVITALTMAVPEGNHLHGTNDTAEDGRNKSKTKMVQQLEKCDCE